MGVRAGAARRRQHRLVNRGFVPLDAKDPATRAAGNRHGTIEIVGVMRWPETRGLFTPAATSRAMSGTCVDPNAIAAAKKWASAAPFYIDQEAPVPPGGWPKPGELVVVSRQSPAIRLHLVWSPGLGRRLCRLACRPLAAAGVTSCRLICVNEFLPELSYRQQEPSPTAGAVNWGNWLWFCASSIV